MIDADGNRLLSQKIPNDEPALLELIATVLKLAEGYDVIWATDLNHGGPALLIAILVAHGQTILYIPGRIVHHASKLYRGEGKTDAKDAAVIADQARMRKDLQALRAGDEIRTGLRILTAGDVWLDPIALPHESNQTMVVATVRFAPGARTAWHSH
ncbi:hypothetical protein GCM10009825_09310 [Arthrobacter humicola]|uniref:Transposase IS110-like N-terminal domain-containing protein n=1 Tax=Arthrobacter humicola TaxID=409291 RepID=A0ABN2YP26_9MICC